MPDAPAPAFVLHHRLLRLAKGAVDAYEEYLIATFGREITAPRRMTPPERLEQFAESATRAFQREQRSGNV